MNRPLEASVCRTGVTVIAALLFLIGGCLGGGAIDLPATRPASTPLLAGRFSGTADCTASATLAGETSEAPPSTVDVEAEIDDLGFPLQVGTAINIGTSETIEIFGGTLQGTITEIRVEGNALVVVRELTGTFAGSIALQGHSVDEYRREGESLTVSITTNVSAGAEVSLQETCTGRLDRQ